MSTSNLKSLLGFIYNLSLLEEETFQLYKDLAEKVDFPLIKALLIEISLDSKKHYHLLKGIIDSMPKVDYNSKDAQKKLNKSQKAMANFSTHFADTTKINENNLPELIEKLTLLESQMGEEYEILVQAKSIVFFASEIDRKYNFKSENFKKIFEKIISDEEHHNEILETIKDIINQKDQELLVKDPLLHYRRLGVPRPQ
jgi:rubrerythrin